MNLRTNRPDRSVRSVAFAAALAFGSQVPRTASARVDAPRFEATAPARPASCASVRPDEDLQTRIERAAEGSSLCLSSGAYVGAFRVDRAVTVWGPRGAVLRSAGQGTTVLITHADAALLGVTIDGSGADFDREDSAVRVEADRVRVEGLEIAHAAFGILVDRASYVTVRDNSIVGNGEPTFGLRGDAIRLWEARHCVVAHNRVEASRDLVVWYSPQNRIVDNVVSHSRYGTHLMFSDSNVIDGNEYRHNVVGVFAMYSHHLTIHRNLIGDAGGSGGIGLGLKDSGDLDVRQNVFVRNNDSVFLDNTPATIGERDRFGGNVFRMSQSAVVFHGSARGNEFVGNSFRDNQTQVVVDGGGDALEATWDRNDFDDYAGYDLDADGIGDLPYVSRSFATQLVSAHPELDYFTGSAAMSLMDTVSKIVPLLEPQTIFVDRHPRMQALALEMSHED